MRQVNPGQNLEHQNGLNNLKTEIEEYYDTQLQELIEPVKYPLFEDGSSANQHYGQLDCSPFEMKI